ncbi:MAG: TIM-barrel domain-containing protein [Kineosporiaceae bacterium]
MTSTEPAGTWRIPTLPSDPVADPRAVVQGDTYRITVLTDGLLRLEYAADGRFEDRASTFALSRRLPVPDFRVSDTGTHLVLSTDRLRLTYDKGPFSTSGLAVEVLGGITTYHSVWRFGQPAPNLGGTARTLDWADGAIRLEDGVVAREGFAVLDDSPSLLWDAEGWVVPRDGSRTDLYVFAYGRDHAAAVRALYAVSGPTPVLPRWALGNWWSRYHAYTADEYEALMTRFSEEGIPFAVAVLDVDWHLRDVDPRYGSGWTGYTWNRELFPDPPGFLRWLHEHGLRVTLNVHPADGIQPYEDVYGAVAQALGRNPADREPIAFDVTDRAFMHAYFEVLHRTLERDGVDFWWIDWQSGPYSRVIGIDPLWMLNHFHYLDNGRDGRRPLAFSRYAGPGSHRYPIGFSGDTVISWESLDFQPCFTATAANIGYGWWSHDIGGHFSGVKDDELATRWLQLGVFSPVLRLHSSSDPFMTKEPWSFGPAARAVQAESLRLRHRLVPYLHTMNHRAADGVPLVRPLYHSWPGDAEAYGHPNEFTFGSELLVAPITRPADRRTLTGQARAWLPPGTWVDVLTDLVYDGAREMLLNRDLSGIPVLARCGAVVPLDGATVPAGDPVNPDHLEVLVVVGADGAFELVEDDGTGDGRDPATVVRTQITYQQATGTATVSPACGALTAVPASRRWTVTFVAVDVPGEAADVGVSASVDGVEAFADVATTATRISVTLPDIPAGSSLVVTLGGSPRLADNDVAGRLFALLDAAQIEFALKTTIQRIATSGEPLHVRLAHLAALGLEPALTAAVDEILLARPDEGAPASNAPGLPGEPRAHRRAGVPDP